MKTMCTLHRFVLQIQGIEWLRDERKYEMEGNIYIYIYIYILLDILALLDYIALPIVLALA